MKTDCGKFDRLLANVRFCYIVVFMAVTSCASMVPVRLMLQGTQLNALMFQALAVFGAIFLVVDLCYHHTLFKPRNCGLLVLFVLSLCISILTHAKYGITDNLKTLVWTCIQLFLFCAIDTDQSPKMHFKQLQILTETYGAIWMFWSSWSLLLFLQQVAVYVRFEDFISYTRVGFADGRLFGLFTDPNYAALGCFAALVFAILNLKLRKCCVASKIYHGVQIAVQLCYIVLSGSRTTVLAMALVLAALGMLLLWRYFEKRGKRVLIRIAACVLSVGVIAFGVLQLCSTVQHALAYLPGVYESLFEDADQPESDPEQTEENGENIQLEIGTPVSVVRPDVEDSSDLSNNRFRIWSDYFKVYLSAPIFGVSPRNAMAYTMDHFTDMFIIDRQYSVHNTYLALLVSTGIVGAGFIYVWILLKAYTVAEYLIRRRNSQDQYYVPVLLLTLILGVYAIAAFPLYFMFFTNMHIDLVFWVTMGYVTGFVRMSEPERQKISLPYRLTEAVFAKFRGKR